MTAATTTTTATARTAARRTLHTDITSALVTPVSRTLLVASMVMAVLSATANLVPLDTLDGEESIQLALHASSVPTLIFALVAGAQSASGDRRSGFVDQRLLTDPSRRRWLAGKAAGLGVVGLVYGVLGAITAAATSAVIFAAKDTALDLASAPVVQGLVGIVVAAPLFAILGVAAGTNTSAPPVAITGALAWVLIVEPPTLLGLPEVGRLLPGAAGLAATRSPDPELLDQVPGMVLLAAYAVAALAFAARRFDRIDL